MPHCTHAPAPTHTWTHTHSHMNAYAHVHTTSHPHTHTDAHNARTLCQRATNMYTQMHTRLQITRGWHRTTCTHTFVNSCTHAHARTGIGACIFAPAYIHGHVHKHTFQRLHGHTHTHIHLLRMHRRYTYIHMCCRVYRRMCTQDECIDKKK